MQWTHLFTHMKCNGTNTDIKYILEKYALFRKIYFICNETPYKKTFYQSKTTSWTLRDTCDVKRTVAHDAFKLVYSSDFRIYAGGDFSPGSSRRMRRQTNGELVETPIVDDADDVRSDDVNEKSQTKSHKNDLPMRGFTQRRDRNEVIEGALLWRRGRVLKKN